MKKVLMVVFSYHHQNTEKIAKTMADVLNAQIKTPQEIEPEEIPDYDLVGFGSGIYSAKHDESLLGLADELLKVDNKNVFLFSTAGITGKSKASKDHAILREKLQSKGYNILDEFQCKGFNTNSFLKIFGGMNKGRPNSRDIQHAEEFAVNLKRITET
ncbi:flavodoxin family protein [Methanobacterium subterraneum]|jgi:flavodoxin|uniref:Flavodoxin n=1 Tax=Methanobacterium subterraneum TaxID=59277 RepID=A0A7J4THJ1_9EURY|nr:flavodoxin family protein [Methanobacterium subterraneum]MBW4256143.1 flavodoxin family protein [Methanobacterium sp. YSL]NMO09314.1 flavodoxin [Methanobacterium subterraneum]HII83896.1 flavodoxin [Methanobacterium subterraneum]